MMQLWEKIRGTITLPGRDDLILALGCLVLTGSILLLAGLPFFNRLEARARLVALRGNAATVQLAVESFARQHLGQYPAGVSELLSFLPGGSPPVNPLDGKPLTFTRRPGDVTYTPQGEGYRIEAWSYGPHESCRRILVLAAGKRTGAVTAARRRE